MYFFFFFVHAFIHITVALKDHSRHDSLAIAVLTHGIGSSFISAKDNLYTVEALWEPFTAEKCTTLAGKPKFFFIQVILSNY